MITQNMRTHTTAVDSDIVKKKAEAAVRMALDGRLTANQRARMLNASKRTRDANGFIPLGDDDLQVMHKICRLEHREQQANISQRGPQTRYANRSRVATDYEPARKPASPADSSRRPLEQTPHDITRRNPGRPNTARGSRR